MSVAPRARARFRSVAKNANGRVTFRVMDVARREGNFDESDVKLGLEPAESCGS